MFVMTVTDRYPRGGTSGFPPLARPMTIGNSENSRDEPYADRSFSPLNFLCSWGRNGPWKAKVVPGFEPAFAEGLAPSYTWRGWPP